MSTQPTSERREIKLKAWDNDKKEFVKFGIGKHTYGYGPHCVPEFRTSEDDTELILQTNLYYARDWNITWIRQTGLKDKNGKEIWESDVVGILMDRLGDSYPNFKENDFVICEVIFETGGFHAVNVEKQLQFPLWAVNNEAIFHLGNIYSNPELLKP